METRLVVAYALIALLALAAGVLVWHLATRKTRDRRRTRSMRARWLGKDRLAPPLPGDLP